MNKNIQDLLDTAVDMYFKGQNWKGFIEKHKDHKKYLKNQFADMFKNWN